MGYVSASSHATYPAPHPNGYAYKALPSSVELNNLLTPVTCYLLWLHLVDVHAEGGPVWEPWTLPAGLVDLDSPGNRSAFVRTFRGRWGTPHSPRHVRRPRGDLPCDLASALKLGVRHPCPCQW